MKLLLFSDLHTDVIAAEAIVRLAGTVDVVIGAGDFARVRKGISMCIDILRQIKKRTVLVPGNNESYDELLSACAGWPSVSVLHGAGVEIGGVPFFGIGGGIPVTPFGAWSCDLSEAEAEQMLASCPAGAVLVSHSPPKGAVDGSSAGRSLGSTALRDAVIRVRPRLMVCGHIHEAAGQRGLIGDTPIINAGPKGLIYGLGDALH
jgi:Icc-related predicted phosphoesterase